MRIMLRPQIWVRSLVKITTPFYMISSTLLCIAFAKWPSPSERKQFHQAFAEFKKFENYSSKPEPKQWLTEQIYIEHFQF